MAKKTSKTFFVNARVYMDVTVPIKAETLEEAIAESKKLELRHFAKNVGDLNENRYVVYGIIEEYKDMEL